MYIDYQTFTCILTLDIYTGKFCYYICSTDVYRYSIDIHKHIALEFTFIIYTNPNTCTGRVFFNGYFIHTHVWILHIPEQADYLSIYVQYIYKSAPNICKDRVSCHVYSTRVHLYSTYIHRQIFLLKMFHIYIHISTQLVCLARSFVHKYLQEYTRFQQIVKKRLYLLHYYTLKNVDSCYLKNYWS